MSRYRRLLLGMGLLAGALAAEAQSTKVYRTITKPLLLRADRVIE